MTSFVFTAYGVPKGQPRARAFSRGGKVRMYDPGTAEGWKAIVAAAAQPFVPKTPHEGPVSVDLDFWMPRPKRLAKAPSHALQYLAKPDADNLAKAVMDCFTEIGIWRDDAQVYYLSVSKYYQSKDGRPGVTVAVTLHNDKEDDQ